MPVGKKIKLYQIISIEFLFIKTGTWNIGVSIAIRSLAFTDNKNFDQNIATPHKWLKAVSI